jgi:sulfhydrogenase subunit beta (sulfur reductase)
MDTLLLSKDKLKDFLKSISDVQLLAPILKNNRTSFETIENLDAVELNLDDYTATIKKAVFPQNETLFAYCSGKKGAEIKDVQSIPKTVVFGIRPCDAKSFVILDSLFKGDFEDPYYLRRREATTLIGHACVEPTNRCFCSSLGGSPFAQEGLDLLLIDINDSAYLVEVLTDKGKAIADSAGDLLSKADKADKDKRDPAATSAQAKIRRSVNLENLHELLPKAFKSDAWKEVGNKCIGCGICTYNCPTCHCFDIQDEGCGLEGRRVRVWDGCMYPEFTVHASGENPRKDRGDRIRNRMLHKFSFYPQNLGHIACVGCGRCIEMCPVNEDLIEILNKVREVVNE